jgi:hypothetical protein
VTTPRMPARRDLRKDLLALGLGTLALAAIVGSCVAGGWPLILTWLGVILSLAAASIGLREPEPAPRDPGLADPDDPNAMHVESVRGPGTT